MSGETFLRGYSDAQRQALRIRLKRIERGEAPLRKSLPSPLIKGRGIKGEGLANNLRDAY